MMEGLANTNRSEREQRLPGGDSEMKRICSFSAVWLVAVASALGAQARAQDGLPIVGHLPDLEGRVALLQRA
jgi:hypothetical protein